MADRVKESYQVIRERNGNYQLRQYNGSHAEKRYTTLGFFVVVKGLNDFQHTQSYDDSAENNKNDYGVGTLREVRKDQDFAALAGYATRNRTYDKYMEFRKKEQYRHCTRNIKRKERFYGDDALDALQILSGHYTFFRQREADLTEKAQELVKETIERLNKELKIEYIRTLLIIFENVRWRFPELLLETFPDDKNLLLRVLRSRLSDTQIRKHMEERFGTKFDDSGEPEYENDDEKKNWYNAELDI